MKKIPTLFQREYLNHEVVKVLDIVTEGCEWVLAGEGTATLKHDGSCCCIINGELYKRYDAKNGKPVPEKAIPCQDKPDAITGHFPCWIKCSPENKSDVWFIRAFENSKTIYDVVDGTYEAIGIHFQGNPYHLGDDVLIKHGNDIIDLPDRSYNAIKEYLQNHLIEGIVFWKDGEPRCKIKRTDFGFSWNAKK
ncbi:MAG: hypothetical protein J6C62_00155 [Clostridia bacterium]|nr:hypothetical protein [Clostridia bacterium]